MDQHIEGQSHETEQPPACVAFAVLNVHMRVEQVSSSTAGGIGRVASKAGSEHEDQEVVMPPWIAPTSKSWLVLSENTNENPAQKEPKSPGSSRAPESQSTAGVLDVAVLVDLAVRLSPGSLDQRRVHHVEGQEEVYDRASWP